MKILLSLVLGISLLFVSGCWSKSEINELAFIMIIGIDKADNGDYLISFKMPQPKSATGGQGKSDISFMAYTFQCPSLTEAADQVYKVVDKSPFMGQTRLIILSESLARQGIRPVLDFLGRYYRLRRNVNMMVAKDDVGKIVSTKLLGGQIPALNITTRIYNQNTNNINEEITIGNVLTKLAVGKQQPVIPGIRYKAPEEDGMQVLTKKEDVIVGEELAVFKGDRLVGWLDTCETRGYMYTTGKSQRVKISVPFEQNTKINLLLEAIKVSKKVSMDNGVPVIQLKLKANADMLETTLSQEQIGNPKLYGKDAQENESKAAETVSSEILAAVNKAKKINSDIFGFGQLVFRQKPETWRELEDKWESEIFPNLTVEVKAEITIRRSGNTTSPPYESKIDRNVPEPE